MTSARELADRMHRRWLEENPFAATMYGIPGYDDLVPDESEEGRRSWRAEVGRFLDEADLIAGGELTPAEAVTLDCAKEAAAEEQEAIDLAGSEYTVTAMQYAGPAAFLAVAARTVLVDSAAAEAYLSRLRRSGAWLDQVGDRLRTGARRGRLPVAPLAEQAVTWAEGVLADPGASPVLAPRPPEGWQATAAWEEQRRAAAEEVVRPALARWVATVRELLPQARPSERAGLAYLPGGEEDYARAVRIYTTLPLSAEELHQTGLDHIAALEARAVKLGTGLGLSGLDEVFAALRASNGEVAPDEAIRQATAAVRRAEARAGEFFPDPLPPPCEVTPMPEVVAVSGAAPHYTPPRLDGGRPGTFWFNTERPTAGTGWDIEVVAFHEAVPGHHPAALPAPAAHRPARPAAPAQPSGVLGGLGSLRRATGRGSRTVRRRPRPARLGQHVADAGRPAGGGHRPALLRLEPGAGPGVPGRPRPDAPGVPGRRGGPLRSDAGPGAGLSHRQARDHP